MYNVHLDLSLVLGGKPNFDLFFCLTCKTPCKKGKTNVYYYRRFRGGPEMGECPRFFALLALVNAHAKNTPPPGGMGQRGWRGNRHSQQSANAMIRLLYTSDAVDEEDSVDLLRIRPTEKTTWRRRLAKFNPPSSPHP